MIDIIVAGIIGGFAKSLAEQKGRIALPGIEKSSDGTKYLHLGFVANVLLGGIVASITATSVITGFTAGIAAAFIVEKLFERTTLGRMGG